MIGSIVDIALNVLREIVPAGEKFEAAKTKLLELEETGKINEMLIKANIINTETTSKSWLTKNWRALLMLSFAFIIFNNYFIAFWIKGAIVPIPDHIWDILKIGVGGYLTGMSLNKSFKHVFKKLIR